MERETRIYAIAGPVLALNCLSLVVTDPPGAGFVSIGYFVGCLFAHAALAAAWAALGPGELRVRLLLSIAWVLALPVTVAANMSVHGRSPPSSVIPLGCCLAGLWFLMALLIAGIKWYSGLRLQVAKGGLKTPDDRPSQYGILDLLGLMTLSAIVIGLGRLILPNVSMGRGEMSAFIFLSVATVVLTIPLIMAALLSRFAVLGVAASLIFLGLASYYELSILESFGGRGPGTADFIAINIASAVLILIITSIVRLNGFCLHSGSDVSVPV